MLGTQRVDGQHQGRVDAARQAQRHALEAVLAHVVAQAQHQRVPQLALARAAAPWLLLFE
jgi:hypothetical protein